jgi:regulatory protein
MTSAGPESLGAGLGPGAKRLLKLAVAALARREHSRTELARKLGRALQPEEALPDVQLVLDRLQSRGLLSDRRMAEALVRTRASRYGRLRIAQELDRRGVDRDTIAATLPPPEDEQSVAMALWRRKFGQPPASLQERARQTRFLAARGFPASIIGRVLSVPED